MSLVRRKYALWLVAVIVAALIGWYLWSPGSTPLITLQQDNLELFRDAFNADSSQARAVLLLSPT
jgi:hypothetical protein